MPILVAGRQEFLAQPFRSSAGLDSDIKCCDYVALSGTVQVCDFGLVGKDVKAPAAVDALLNRKHQEVDVFVREVSTTSAGSHARCRSA